MRVSKFTGVAAGIAAATLLAGCSAGGGSTPSGEQDITVWLYPVIADEAVHKDFWDTTIAAFEKDNKDVNVKYEIFPWANRDESLQTAIAAGKGPDLVYLVPDQLAAYQKSILPLNDLLSEERQGDLLPNVKTSVTIDGDILGAPVLTSAQPLICNAAAFEAAGVTEYPETWDDIIEMAPKFTEKGMYALNYPASAENTLNLTYYPLLWQAGGEVFTKDGDVGFDSKAGEQALTFITDLAESGALDPEALTTNVPLEQTAIAQGKVACTWNNGVTEVAPFWGEENVKVLAPLTDKKTVAYGTVGSLSVLKGSKAPEAAAAFAEYATSADVIEPYLTAAGYFSALSTTEPLYADDPLLGEVEKYVPDTTVGELNASSRALMGVLAPEIQAALLGQKAPADALKDAAAAAAPLLKK
ncbi:ABC transporter substrate-binding protein [Microbacterium saperdae]|uniref:Multiple sugar transport system substrate-binding protein n=1 Tax=Microbacterium saperdae TaxID=69368 RepID=A0A543BB38_9MICO|nr:extracellular solute-binding protein [Microbacterium saperdae]TQL82038.1 multiple sugar transport system substrate-binding protein [Microbacterium saperdae]GGM36699.1 sugar ABC transporter substrate-binding protein [Microbacterium saperdae]